MKRNTNQNRQLYALMSKHGIDDEMKRDMAHSASQGRTTKTSELTVEECQGIINGLNARKGGHEAPRKAQTKLERLQWTLRYAFAWTKYEGFWWGGTPGKPHLKAIDDYCLKWWKKRVDEMTERELEQCIAIINKWDKHGTNKRQTADTGTAGTQQQYKATVRGTDEQRSADAGGDRPDDKGMRA